MHKEQEDREMEAWWALYDVVMPNYVRDHLKVALNPLGKGLPDDF